MTTAIVGVRATRNATLMFVESNSVGTMLNDLVLVESGGSHFLAVVNLTTEQFVANPAPAATGRVIAATDSADVAGAVRRRNIMALEVARAELGPEMSILAACWSADSGRVTLEVDCSAADLPGIVEKMEPCYRAEVRCVSGAKPVTSE